MNRQSNFMPSRYMTHKHDSQLRPPSPGGRKLSIEALERRELLTVGNLLHTLHNPAPVAEELFGISVALSGDVAAAGTIAGKASAEAAYLFDAASGNLLHSIPSPSPPSSNTGTRHSVAVSAESLLVGAPYVRDPDYGTVGAAYLFDTDTGALHHSFPNPTPSISSDQFGFSVALSSSRAVVGKPQLARWEIGAVSVFDTAGGSLLRTINDPDPVAYGQFGFSVAVSDSHLLVGDDGGVAYLFDVETGELLHTLHNPKDGFHGSFGFSVALSGDYALVGAWADDTAAVGAGAAYLFDVNTGQLLHTLLPPQQNVYGSFGFSVELSGNTALVGAPFDDIDGIDAGAAYLFDTVTGSLIDTIHNPTPDTGDFFGFSVALSGNKALVSAPWDDSFALNAGAAYLFDVSTASEVAIDIHPDSINLASNGLIAAAILTTADFDAATVDASTVVFAGATAVHNTLEDVDGDGDLDMVLQFRVQDTTLAMLYEQLLVDAADGDGILDSNRQTAVVSLTGETIDGEGIMGSDEVDVFFSGKALRDLLEELALAGIL